MHIDLNDDVVRKYTYSGLKTETYLAKTQGAKDPFPLIPDEAERANYSFAHATDSREHARQATRFVAMDANAAHSAQKCTVFERFAENFIKSAHKLPIEKAKPVLSAFADEVAHLLNFNNNHFVPPACIKVIEKLDKCKALKDYKMVLSRDQYDRGEFQMRMTKPSRIPYVPSRLDG